MQANAYRIFVEIGQISNIVYMRKNTGIPIEREEKKKA